MQAKSQVTFAGCDERKAVRKAGNGAKARGGAGGGPCDGVVVGVGGDEEGVGVVEFVVLGPSALGGFLVALDGAAAFGPGDEVAVVVGGGVGVDDAEDGGGATDQGDGDRATSAAFKKRFGAVVWVDEPEVLVGVGGGAVAVGGFFASDSVVWEGGGDGVADQNFGGGVDGGVCGGGVIGGFTARAAGSVKFGAEERARFLGDAGGQGEVGAVVGRCHHEILGCG